MSLRILAGSLKGQTIPLPAKVKGHREVTPQKVKKALFQILANQLTHFSTSAFCDLFAGSGQIGFEAASRGFAEVWLCEIDKKRHEALQSLQKKFLLSQPIHILHKDGFVWFSQFFSNPKEGFESLVFFADPPYPQKPYQPSPWQKLFQLTQTLPLPPYPTLLIMQAPKEQSQIFTKAQSYIYGNHCLLLFSFS